MFAIYLAPSSVSIPLTPETLLAFTGVMALLLAILLIGYLLCWKVYQSFRDRPLVLLKNAATLCAGVCAYIIYIYYEDFDSWFLQWFW